MESRKNLIPCAKIFEGEVTCDVGCGGKVRDEVGLRFNGEKSKTTLVGRKCSRGGVWKNNGECRSRDLV